MAGKSIGPTFGNELYNAGLLGLNFSWGSDGTIIYGPGITQDQRNAINAVYAAHDPVISNLLDYSDFQAQIQFSGGKSIDNVMTAVSPDAVSLLHQYSSYAEANPGVVVHIIAPDHTVTDYSAAEAINLYNVVMGFVKNVYDVQAQLANDIGAG